MSKQLKCINNTGVEDFLTLGKVYTEQCMPHDFFITDEMYRVCGGWFFKYRFQIITEDKDEQ